MLTRIYLKVEEKSDLNPNSINNFAQKILVKYEIIVMCDPKVGKIAE